MTETDDSVIATGLGYETATLLTLKALKAKCRNKQGEACRRWILAVVIIENMAAADDYRALSHGQQSRGP